MSADSVLFGRYAEEFPGAVGRLLGEQREVLEWWGGSASPGGGFRRGAAEPGRNLPLPGEQLGAQPLDDQGELVLAWGTTGALGPVLFRSKAWFGSEELFPDQVEVALAAGPVTVSALHGPLGFGRGGVVFGGAGVTRLELRTARPFQFPGWLAYLGLVSADFFVTRAFDDRHDGDPWLLGGSVSLRPHPRLTLALHRGLIFGGDAPRDPLTPRALLLTLIGVHHGDLDDGKVSGEIRYRLPSEGLLPLFLYLESGAEDSAGAFRDVPGLVMGALAPSLPFAPTASLGVERAYFARSCCFNPPWYRHATFRGGWALNELPLGHPLGGHGKEWALNGSALLFEAALWLELRLFARERGSENLFSPEREGESRGVDLKARWRVGPRLDAGGWFFQDSGDGWRESRGSVSLGYLF